MGNLAPTTKTKRTSSKKSSLSDGSVRAELERLNTSISLAKGLLATLSTSDQSAWMRKCTRKVAREHTRILLQEVMDEIWNADETLTRLMKGPRPRLML